MEGVHVSQNSKCKIKKQNWNLKLKIYQVSLGRKNYRVRVDPGPIPGGHKCRRGEGHKAKLEVEKELAGADQVPTA